MAHERNPNPLSSRKELRSVVVLLARIAGCVCCHWKSRKQECRAKKRKRRDLMAVQGNSVFEDSYAARPLFGGAIMCCIPANFHDVSHVREVPNNQEAFVDPNRDESIIVELLELKDTVVDERSSRWFLQDLANEQDSEQNLVVESEKTITTAVDVPNVEASIPVNVTVGTLHLCQSQDGRLIVGLAHPQAIAKSRQGDDARNLVRVHLANIRLHGVKTDVVITVYEPLIINEWSQSAAAVGAGTTVPAALAGCMAAPDVLKLVLSTFKICDWNLFG